ncbi:MAG: hypothetical protein DRI73_03280 [Bacteroidetes bacterium]|nr:MAG: hypothetical protein DRI73_03280 [Bacteroidota bacterium]
MRKFIFHPYIILNLSFSGIILLIFLYAGIFSAQKDDHPVPSVYEEILYKKSPTSGLSHSFSEIIRGNFPSAKAWNKNGIPIFTFFLIQFLLRIISSYLIVSGKIQVRNLVWADSLISISLFLICFKNLLTFWKFF